MQVDTIRRITISASGPGVAETTAALGKLSSAQRDAASAAASSASGPSAYEAALAKQQRQIESSIVQMNQLQAAQQAAGDFKMSDAFWKLPNEGTESDLLTTFLKETVDGAEASGAALIRWGRVLTATGAVAVAGYGSYLALSGQISAIGDYGKLAGDKLSSLVTWLGTLDGKTLAVAGTFGVLGAAFVLHHAQADEAANDNEKLSGSFGGVGQSSQSAGSSMTSFVTPVTATVAAVAAASVAVQKFVKDLADMGGAASRSGLDLTTFQQLKFVAGGEGVSSKDFSSGAEKMAMALNDATRNENDLSKLLDINNVKFKDANGLLIDTNKLFDVARGLIQNAANAQDKIKIAEMLGLTKEWVPMLDKGAKAFDDAKNEASALGLVIDASVIARAKQFDDEWRKSSVVLTTQVQAALAGLLPVLDSMITKASTFISTLANSQAAGNVTTNAGRAAEILSSVPEDATLKESAIGMALALKALVGGLDDTNKAMIDNSIAANAEAKMWNDIARGWEGAAAAGQKLAPVIAAVNGDATKIPSKSTATDTRDAWDRAVTSIEKHTLTQQADTIAVGQATSVAAGLKAEFQLLEAAKTADKGVTDAQIAQYVALRGSMEAQQALVAAGIKLNTDDAASFDRVTEAVKVATAANTLAQVNNQIGRDRQLIFLDPINVEIANKLKGLYPDIETALNSDEAAAMRFNAQLKQTVDASNAFGQTLLSGLLNGQKGFDALTAAAKQFIATMASDALKRLQGGGSIFGTQSLGSVNGGLTVASAGLAGYQSGSPLAGALGGALAGAAFGPVGAVVGGVVGLAGGLLGQSAQAAKAEKARIEQAQTAWANAKQSADAFEAAMSGTSLGTLGPGIAGARSQMQQLVDLAHAAGDQASVNQLQNAFNVGSNRMISEFVAAWPRAISDLFSGVGQDSPFKKAEDAFTSLGESLKGFVADAQYLESINSSVKGMSAYAQQATQAFALAQLSLQKPLDDTMTTVQTLQGQAQSLQTVLVSLGMSADDAAKAIATKLSAAIADVATNFTYSVQRLLNAAQGKDYLNNILDSELQIQQFLADAAKLGTAVQPIMDLQKAAAQKIVDDNQLTGAAFDQVLQIFPQLQGVIHSFVASVTGDLASFNKDVQAKINTATGKDYLNGVSDLIDQVATLTQQAKSLGADPTLITRFFDVSAQKIVDDAKLTGQAFDELVTAFPQLQGVVTAFVASVTGDLASFNKDVQAKINTATGKDYLNGISDLIDQVTTLTQQAKTLGADPTLITRFFDVSAQKIINDSRLTGQAFDDLVAVFPQLQGVVTAFVQSTTEDVSRLKGYQDRLFATTVDTSTLGGAVASALHRFEQEQADEIAAGGLYINDLVTTQQAELSGIYQSFAQQTAQGVTQAFTDAQTFISNFDKTIKTFLDNLSAGPQSTLSPGARLTAAQGQYTSELALTHSTDAQTARDALDAITQYANNLEDAARAEFGSAAGYQTILAQIKTDLGALPTQISPEQLIVNAVNSSSSANTASILAMQTAIGTAVTTANPSNIATALATYFNTLDTNTDGLLTQDELATKMKGVLTDTQVATIFKTLDTDHSGMLTALGLIQTATTTTGTNTGNINTGVGTIGTNTGNINTGVGNVNAGVGNVNTGIGSNNTKTDTTNTSLVSVNSALATSNSSLTTANNSLASVNSALATSNSNLTSANNNLASVINNLSSVISNQGSQTQILQNTFQQTQSLSNINSQTAGTASALTTTNASLSTVNTSLSALVADLAAASGTFAVSYGNGAGGATSVTVSNSMLLALEKIVWNTYTIATNTLYNNAQIGARWQTGTFATGGFISGPGTGTSDSIPAWLSNGEGVITAAATAALGGRGAIDNLNAGRIPVMPMAFSGANDNSAVVSELRAMRQQLTRLENELTQSNAQIIELRRHTARGADNAEATADNTAATVKEIKSRRAVAGRG